MSECPQCREMYRDEMKRCSLKKNELVTFPAVLYVGFETSSKIFFTFAHFLLIGSAEQRGKARNWMRSCKRSCALVKTDNSGNEIICK